MPLYLLVDSSGSTVLNGFNLGCNQALPQLAAVLEAACGDHARIAAPVTAHPEPGKPSHGLVPRVRVGRRPRHAAVHPGARRRSRHPRWVRSGSAGW